MLSVLLMPMAVEGDNSTIDGGRDEAEERLAHSHKSTEMSRPIPDVQMIYQENFRRPIIFEKAIKYLKILRQYRKGSTENGLQERDFEDRISGKLGCTYREVGCVLLERERRFLIFENKKHVGNEVKG